MNSEDADLKRAREIANKIATDAMLRQGSSIKTIAQALRDVRNETIEKASMIAENHLQYQTYGKDGLGGCGCGPQISSHIRALKDGGA